MSEFEVKIQVRPHSSSHGAHRDKLLVGDLGGHGRIRTFRIYAEDMKDAGGRADLIALGILSHPMCWRAPIVSIVQIDDRFSGSEHEIDSVSSDTWARQFDEAFSCRATKSAADGGGGAA